MDIIETIKEQIANNTILLYMKGSPNAPQCGFSAKAAQAVMGVAKSSRTSTSCRTRKSAPTCQNTPTGQPSRNCGWR
jgi:glutaredoxin-related protein